MKEYKSIRSVQGPLIRVWDGLFGSCGYPSEGRPEMEKLNEVEKALKDDFGGLGT